MLSRELTYEVSLKRLSKLSRSAGRKAYPTLWLLTWLWVFMFLAALGALVIYGHALDRWMKANGFSAGSDLVFWGFLVVYFAGWLVLRRRRISAVRDRIGTDENVRLTQDDGGLRFVTSKIEYYLKWQGIAQMLLENDGVVVSCGNLFFLVPDVAFASADERLAFIRDVYGRLTEKARSISDEHVRAALENGGHRPEA